MVKYIKIGKEKRKEQDTKPSGIKKYIAIGTAGLLIGGLSFEYIRHISYWKPRVHTALSINSPASLEYRIDNLEQDLSEFPQYTDNLVYKGIRAMQEKELSFSPENYMEMFGIIKNKIEDNPELLDHLGPNALAYQETRVLRTCKNQVKDAYQSIRELAVETKDKLKNLFTE
ncbi:MAG: hypothetical protein U9R34_00020 [Nanoarchaeota archaeon]|nr:hypothetical protein [Nanoarchaeota archaeon]